MAWLSASIETDSLHVEALADALMAAGALSVSIEDADAGTANETPQFGEPGSLSTPTWERSRIIALLEPDANVGGLIADCAQTAGLDNCPAFIQEEVAEQNWVQLTQSQFEPIRVSQGLWIVPSWHQAPDPGLRAQRFPGVLDYGCGSGILAIAANKLGATDVLGVDIDVQAIGAAKGNAERNNVSARFEDSSRGIRGQFDIVVANILSNPLKALAPAICAHVRSGGKLALSGILVEQAETLINTYAPFLPLGVADTREGWVCLAGTKA